MNPGPGNRISHSGANVSGVTRTSARNREGGHTNTDPHGGALTHAGSTCRENFPKLDHVPRR